MLELFRSNTAGSACEKGSKATCKIVTDNKTNKIYVDGVLVYQNDEGTQDRFTKIGFEIDYCASSLTIHAKDFESGCSSGVLTLNVLLAIQHAGTKFIATMIVRNCGGTREDRHVWTRSK